MCRGALSFFDMIIIWHGTIGNDLDKLYPGVYHSHPKMIPGPKTINIRHSFHKIISSVLPENYNVVIRGRSLRSNILQIILPAPGLFFS